MNWTLLAILASLAGLPAARADPQPTPFPPAEIDGPELSLRGAADEALRERLRDVLTPKPDVLAPTLPAQLRSRMPVVEPRNLAPEFVKAPDRSRDYKLRTVRPSVESGR